MPEYITFENVRKTYKVGEVSIRALNEASFTVKQGEICVIVGASGAGKTTVLNILGGMDTMTDGHVWLDGNEISTYSEKQLTAYRRYDIGFVFQFYNLIPNLTALENVELAVQICKDHLDPSEVICEVGLAERKDNFPAQLSGGEQQRVAIARAFINDPDIILADEPTASLDAARGRQVVEMIQKEVKKRRKAAVMVTHDERVLDLADRVLHLIDGRLE